MNFLAHFQLAWPDPGLIAGGLEGDYYKGPLRGDLPHSFEQGIRLHRAIDAYTDHHPLIAAARQQFPSHLRRYAGILIDLCFDHYLSQRWQQHHEQSLESFSRAVYRTLADHRALLSPNAARMSERLQHYDLLQRYRDWQTVPASAERIGERFRRGNPMLAIDTDLAALREPLGDVFDAFYPELKKHTQVVRQQMNLGPKYNSNIAKAAQNP